MRNPTDIRNHNWDTIRAQLGGRIQEVYCAWLAYGPCTTRALANRSGIDLLNVRPRTTDLCGLGLVELAGAVGGDGIYRARNQSDWEQFAAEHRPSVGGQLNLSIPA